MSGHLEKCIDCTLSDMTANNNEEKRKENVVQNKKKLKL